MNSSWLDRNRNLIFISLLLIAAGGAAIFYLRQPVQASVEIRPLMETTAATVVATPSPTPSPTSTPAPVRVYVSGAVANSDVYFLPAGSIIKDAVTAAGGFTAEADPERINQALELQDQQQIHVPRRGEDNPPPPVQGGVSPAELSSHQGSGNSRVPAGSDAAAGGGLININTATPEQLDSLPGVGPAIAQRIIDYREKIGGFKAAEEITEVSGIGEATWAKIKDLITVQ
ncbi:MAG: helix-hairpin-helix domain-containing protein [Anaerolineae bacterium]|nr:helix-hairpin-helix domain-containing protein [Anaerolineae bacterium]